MRTKSVVMLIWLGNSLRTSRTKLVDTWVHFVRDLTQSDPTIMETRYVPSEDNQSDTLTKNVANNLFWKHTSKHMVDAFKERSGEGRCGKVRPSESSNHT
jgi:hypothetical protein